MSAKLPTTLATTERGVSTPASKVRVGMYIWHRGAFRLVTAHEGHKIRMGRYVLRNQYGMWCEVSPT